MPENGNTTNNPLGEWQKPLPSILPTATDETKNGSTGLVPGNGGLGRTITIPDHLWGESRKGDPISRLDATLRAFLTKQAAPVETIYGADSQYEATIRAWPLTVTLPADSDLMELTTFVEAAMMPIKSAELMNLVEANLSLFYRPNQGAEDSKAAMLLWADDLGEFPHWVVDEAFRHHRRADMETRPTPGLIRNHCNRIERNARGLLNALRQTWMDYEASE